MAYRCDQAEIGSPRDAIRCKVSGGPCAHQRMCLMEGRRVLTDGALRCPARNGQLPEEPKKAEPVRTVVLKTAMAQRAEAESKPEKKAAGTAARKTATTKKKTGAKK